MLKNNKTISILGCGWLGLEVAKHFIDKQFLVKGSTTSENKLGELKKAGIFPFLLRANPLLDAPRDVLSDFFSSEILLLNIPPGRRNPNVKTDHPKQIEDIIQKADKYGVKKIIFISSTGVYGNHKQLAEEGDELAPTRDSGHALVAAERILKETKGLKITILRLAGLIGGDRKAGRFFAGKTQVKGGDLRVNMVWRKDCIKVIDAVISQQKWGEIYNVCADEHPKKRDFYVQRAIKEGFEPPTFSDESESKTDKVVSNEKVKIELGIEFTSIF